MKDYKCFFYQYSDFHVFTRQSSDENCYQHTNYNIMVSNQNDVTPGGHPGSHHTHGTKPSYKNLTAVIHEMFSQNSLSQTHEKSPDVTDIARYLKRSSTNIV